MHWETVMTRFHDILPPGGFVAVVEGVADPLPWSSRLGFIGEYSLNQDFEPYTMLTVTEELEERGLFRRIGVKTTNPFSFRQSVDDYVESFHAKNGLSRDRMGGEEASAFDRRVSDVVLDHCPSGEIEMRLRSRVIWGKPQRASQMTG